ncbi:hypothetical protein QBC38DRAFT_67191 [Podospora fimiseda]|uniref:F-box domain-containing protein n=1 Tax=Podospora fimiseda TaxID=252190 RepID=A0AAN7BGS1_9PEZI|nr:hypothetical protein QBC38DRAFT_67191 [Podospora fimiseda]
MTTVEPTKSYKFLKEYLAEKKSEYRTLYKQWRAGSNAYDYPPWYWTNQCPLIALPHELLLMICENLYLADLLHLALTCHMFADLTIPIIYTLDVTRFDCLSLRWGCTFGILETLERSFSYGATANHTFSSDSALNCNWGDGKFTFSYLCLTPLMIAIRWNEIGVIRFLLRNGVKVDQHPVFNLRYQRYHGCYPLHFALGIPGENLGPSFEPGRPAVIRCLIEAGADPNQQGSTYHLRDPTTPLSLAMTSAVPVETLKILLQAGADPFAFNIAVPDHVGLRPLRFRFASVLNRPSFTQLEQDKIDLLLAYTEPSKLVSIFTCWLERLHDGYSYSLCQQYARITLLFIKNAVDLVSCVESGISPIVSFIHGARQWARSIWERRPVKPGKVIVVMDLLYEVIAAMCEATVVGTFSKSCQVKRSAIIDAVNSNPKTRNGYFASRDNSALQIVCMPFGFPGRPTLIPLLLQYGASPFRTDSDGASVLHHAAIFGLDDRMRPLLEFRGTQWSSQLDVNVRDKYGWTPLHYACLFGIRTKLKDQVRIARLLLDHGADVRARTDDGWTCLEFAFRCGNDDMVSLLLDRGARAEDQTRPPGWEETEASSHLIMFYSNNIRARLEQSLRQTRIRFVPDSNNIRVRLGVSELSQND